MCSLPPSSLRSILPRLLQYVMWHGTLELTGKANGHSISDHRPRFNIVWNGIDGPLQARKTLEQTVSRNACLADTRGSRHLHTDLIPSIVGWTLLVFAGVFFWISFYGMFFRKKEYPLKLPRKRRI